VSDSKQQILAWCRDGDQEVFRRFYREQSAKLWKFLVARGCDRETAYDILAEAFLRFIQNVCRDPSAPVALLYRIALNLRVDVHRRAQAARIDPAENPNDLQAPSETAELGENADIRGLIATLATPEQNLLLMRYWIGLSHKEVAQALDMPEGTVRRQSAEILEKLRKRLDQP
jgi:RNA polymerase sigma-70 factor (ECF subfamily)